MNPLLIAAVVVLVLCSAFFSSAEIVLNSASPHKLRSKAESGDKRAIRAQRIKENYTQVLSTVLVGNNLVNNATTAVITVLAIEVLGARGQTYAELITTLLLLICGEIVPKILAADHCNQLVLTYSAPLQFFLALFKPVVWLVSKLVGLLSPLWTPKKAEPTITDEELVMVVETIQDEGVITESEGELIKSAIEFSDTTVHEIMTPRVDLLAVDVDGDLEELFADEDVSHYTRIPVYEETVDRIVGIVNIGDILKKALEPAGLKGVDLRKLMAEPKFVHTTKNISDLLGELRDEGRNMAVVLDDYGGTVGIVTTEDILEELVGDIWDEHDEVIEQFQKQSDGSYLISCSADLDDLYEMFSLTGECEANTVSGWVLEQVGRIPEEGDVFRADGLEVTVTKVDHRRVLEIRVVVLPQEQEEK